MLNDGGRLPITSGELEAVCAVLSVANNDGLVNGSKAVNPVVVLFDANGEMIGSVDLGISGGYEFYPGVNRTVDLG
jgi:hypothetical protein